jgi:branched-subunit amino acid ABC-type transport system permease component
MALVLQVIVTGLAAGAGYGLLAIGLAVIHRLTGVVHLALGELVALAVVVTLLVAAGPDLVTPSSVDAAPFVGGLLAGLAAAVLAGVGTYWLAVRPFLRRGLTLGWLGAIVAVAFAVRGALAAALVRDSYVFPDPLPFDRVGTDGSLVLSGGVTIPVRAFFVFAVGLVLAEVTARVLDRSRWGRALRAVATEPDGAHLTGLPVDRLLAGAFALAGGLAAMAAIVQAPSVPITVDTGSLLGLKGLVAAVLVGFGSPRRAFLAGLVVGLVETAVATYDIGPLRLGAEYRDLVPLALAVVVLGWRRLGTRAVE